MTIAITQEQRDLTKSIRDWAARVEPRAGLREHRPDEPAAVECPSGLAGLGLFGIAVPEKHGGSAGSIVDLAAGLEQAAAALAPGPVLGSALAGVLLSDATDSPVAKELVPQLVAGDARAAVVTEPGEVRGTVTPDGGLILCGSLAGVPEMDPASHLVAPVTVEGWPLWCVLEPETPGVTVTADRRFDLSRTVANVEFDGTRIDADALLTGIDSARARNLALTLACAEAAGVAAECLRIAADYAKVREQFGQVIGGFQAVKQLCAEMLCRSELAGALAWDAARAANDRHRAADQHEIAATAAAAYVLDAAVDNAKDCIQVLGGIGFTWEHDAHLYLRRAVALRGWFGGSSRWRRRSAELALAGGRRDLELVLAAPARDRRPAVVAARLDAVDLVVAELIASPSPT